MLETKSPVSSEALSPAERLKNIQDTSPADVLGKNLESVGLLENGLQNLERVRNSLERMQARATELLSKPNEETLLAGSIDRDIVLSWQQTINDLTSELEGFQAKSLNGGQVDVVSVRDWNKKALAMKNKLFGEK